MKRKVQMVLLQSQKQEQMDKMYCESRHEVCERVKVQVWRECSKCATGWNAECFCRTVEVYQCPVCKSTRTDHPHFPFLHRSLIYNNITYCKNAIYRCARIVVMQLFLSIKH